MANERAGSRASGRANERASGRTSGVVACPACGTRNRVPADATGTPRCAKCHTALPWLADGGDGTYDAVVARSPLPVLVDLWAPWCGPCRMVSPAVEQVGRDLAGQLKVVKINVDDNPRSAARFDAMSIPTLVIVDHGAVVDRQVGAVPAPALRAWVDRALASIRAT
jgi:thioredoxin 2